ncbi:glycoside hydrolase family 47 protein [Amanita thiersii Skay4041]|uniref:alpha-1,2-Mannosidase n=1 Tax=Amanita thiersii Skay4041 TaxID=703135 RepID=A0A2A9NRK6_9AGAR|nr:glycoside hydrolase family 47 protein [Amanita thiersii Skay4041]
MPRLLARWIPLIFVFVSFIFFTTFFIPTTHWPQRAKRVREAFIHAYKGYRTYAWPSDELLPVSGSSVNNFNGWGVTLFDALDTMWLMGLHDMFREAVGLVYKYAPFFETVIRCLGGLLSAYSLSGEPILLMRADDLGMKLLPAFNTESGLPMFAVNTVSGKTKQGWNPYVLWSEAFSNQLEYKLLAHYTGRSIYYNKTESVMQILYHANISDGLFPTHWDIKSGHPTNNHHTVGAYADSAHEYLLKQWLLTGRSEPNPRDLYLQSVNGILRNLTYITPRRKLLYVTDISNGKPSHTFEHLSCFLPGLLALGVYTLPDMAAQDKELHMWAAKGLAYTCYITYADHATGLGPDEMKMSRWYPDDLEGSWLAQLDIWEMQERPGAAPPGLQESPPATTERDYHNLKNSYLLRPETIESFYILWRVTGEEKWRERGWEIFEAIEMHARTEYGYASIAAVDSIPVYLKDDMPSFFLAETLKYFYLLFTDDDILPLTEWVLNTEAHPFPIFDWNSWEKEEYGVSG